jgi:hypothetical protein
MGSLMKSSVSMFKGRVEHNKWRLENVRKRL